jgi:6-phosphogluconolactonase
MRHPRAILAILVGLLLLALLPATAAAAPPENDGPRGAVFTLSNAPAQNRVLVFARGRDGSLTPAGSVSTGGTGTGVGLGSQGALALSGDHHWLYAVNPGSNEISVFRVRGTHLTLVEVAPSGGQMPISVTARGSLVYALNAGGDGNIQGFWRNHAGTLSPIAGSNEPLSQAAAGPAQIGFSPNGQQLVVTEKATNRITFYDVDHGVAGPPAWRDSAGATPYGFAFARNGTLVVSEAFGGATDASAASSYRFGHGQLNLLDGSVATTETAACWTAVTRNGRFAYVTNTGSGSVSGYSISSHGQLQLLDADGVTGSTGTGSTPIDVALDANSRHMYVLLAGSHALAAFGVGRDGALVDLGQLAGLPAGAAGLAAY